MSRSTLSLEELYALLPDLDELEDLRLALIGAAAPDPAREWDGPAIATTVDKRVISADRATEVVAEMEAAQHDYVTALFGYLRPLARAYAGGRRAEAIHRLIELGDWFEQSGRYPKARRCFETALSLSLPLADKSAQIHALRRVARVARAMGDLDEALLYYRRSADLAEASDDARECVIATTGCGNVLASQGRWAEAESYYRQALRRIGPAGDDALRLQTVQLWANLGMLAARQDRLEAADRWFDEALRLWPEAEASSAELAACYFNLAMLRTRQGRGAEAREVLHSALALPIPHWLNAAIALDLAESYQQDGDVTRAEQWGREAEQQAIRAHSPYYLADTYRGLGRLVWAMGDENGVTFFEKALELARKKGYLLVEGETLLDYARLRADTGQLEEAQAYLERAHAIFGELGAVSERARAEFELARLRGSAARARAAGQ